MKLKTIMYCLLTAAGGLLCGCSSDHSGSENPGPVPPEPIDDISVVPAACTFPAEGGETEFRVLCEGGWHLIPSDGWFRFEPASGMGETVIRVTAGENFSEISRTGVLEAVTEGEARVGFNLFQEASQSRMEVSLAISSDYFIQGDAIGLYLVNRVGPDVSAPLPDLISNQVNNACFIIDESGVWNTKVPLYWQDARTSADAYVYYPWASSPGTDPATMPMSAKTDQTDANELHSSCLLYGHVEDAVPGALLTITPAILSAQVVAEISLDALVQDVYRVEAVAFGGLRTTGRADLNAGSLTAVGNPANIKGFLSHDASFMWEATAVVPPQLAEQLVVRVTYWDRVQQQTETREFFFCDLQLKPGLTHRFSLRLDAQPDPVEIEGVTVERWNDGGSFDLDFE